MVTVPTNSKKDAYQVSEDYFRKKFDLPKNITLQNKTVFEGDNDACTDFHDQLAKLMEDSESESYGTQI